MQFVILPSYSIKKLRMTVLLSCGVFSFIGIAQSSVQERLNQVLESQDIARGLKLYDEIIENDIIHFPDSTLFDYHYLGGWVNTEIPNHQKAIMHLLEAKKLCETSLGVYSIQYMDVMNGLGNEYIELNQYDDALGIFQEGIVKSMAVRESAPHAFGNLILGVQECYEYFGWFNEIPNHLLDAWSFWPKDDLPLKTYSYYPLWLLERYYDRYGMYDKAISISDKIEEFIISKGGDKNPELCEALYMRGSVMTKAQKKKEAILTYEKGIAIAKSNNIVDSELLGMLYGNLLATLSDEGDFHKCEELMPSVQLYSEAIRDEEFYANSLYTCALHFGQSHYYKEAIYYLDKIPEDIFSIDELSSITEYRESLLQEQNILLNFDRLIESQNNEILGSANWYNVSYDIAKGYMIKGKLKECLRVLEEVYEVYKENPANENASPLYLFGMLLNLTSQLEENSLFMDYAVLYNDFLNERTNLPDLYLIESVNLLIVGQLKCHKIEEIDERLNLVESYYRDEYGVDSKEYATYLNNRGCAFQLQNKLEEAKSTLLKALSIQNKKDGQPSAKTFEHLMEVENLLGEI